MPVQQGNDENSLLLDQVDEPVGSDDQLPKTGQRRVGKPVTPIRKALERLGRIDRELGQAPGVDLGVPGDESDGVFEVVDGGIGPGYLASHLERRFFTCPWLWTRPAATASMLRSIFCRTYSSYCTSSSVQFSGSFFTRSRTALFALPILKRCYHGEV